MNRIYNYILFKHIKLAMVFQFIFLCCRPYLLQKYIFKISRQAFLSKLFVSKKIINAIAKTICFAI